MSCIPISFREAGFSRLPCFAAGSHRANPARASKDVAIAKRLRWRRSSRQQASPVSPKDWPLLPTEDDFLRLDDMERFVQDAEEAAMRERASNDQEGAGEEAEDEDEESSGTYSLRISIHRQECTL